MGLGEIRLSTTILTRAPQVKVLAASRSRCLETLNLASRGRGFWVQIIALVGTALLDANVGEAQRAVEIYAIALRYGSVANSVWFRDVVGQTIAGAAADLSPDEHLRRRHPPYPAPVDDRLQDTAAWANMPTGIGS